MIVFILVALIALVSPLIITMTYLYRHRLSNGATAEVRRIIFYFMGAYAFIISAETVATVLSLFNFHPTNVGPYVTLLFAVPIGVAAYANWWAFFKIKGLL